MAKKSHFSKLSHSPPGGSGADRSRYRPQKIQQRLESRASGKTANLSDTKKIDFNNTRVVVGTHAVSETLKTNASKIQRMWLQKGFESSMELRKLEEESRTCGIPLELKAKEQLTKEFPAHQGAVLIVEGRPRLNWDDLVEKTESMVLFLDGIEDPHNLGAILRTAWLMGVDALFIPQDRSVHLTATVHKVACGGVEHVPVEIVPSFQASVEKLKEQGFWVFGLSHKASKVLYNFKLPEKVIWVIGAEDKGLRTTTEKLCDEMARLPQISAEASYNASVATALALGETSRQRWGQRS